MSRPVPPPVPPQPWWDRWRARTVAALALVVMALPAIPPLGPLPPAAADTCEGVWVVVDARAAGGALSTRCAPGDPASGLVALEDAGHTVGFVPRIPGMVCTIDARPDPCNAAPAEAYWSYWHAPAGGTWTYAALGAGARDPEPGSVEGWRFGDGSAPPGTPPPATAPPPPPPADTSTEADHGGTDQGQTDQGGSAPTPPEPHADRDTVDPSPAPAPPAPAPPATAPPAPAPPAPGAAAPDAAAAAEPAGTEPGTAEDADDEPARADGTDAVRATRGSPQRSTSRPIGAIVAVGLLAGIGALTWRQRQRRDAAAT